jgi:hypothetical protein
MKLKKVTALLLATSMVLSSVSVASFADDELIFEPEVSVTTEAGEDEAYFGDDVVTGDEQNEEDSASDETFFADEVIEDDQVNDDVIAEDTADDQEAYAFEEDASVDEPIVDGNEDIYAAIAGEDVSYDEYSAPASIPDVEKTYDSSALTIGTGEGQVDTSGIVVDGGQIWWIKDTATAAGTDIPLDAAGWTTTFPTIKNVADSSAANIRYAAKVVTAAKTYGPYEFKVTIKPADLTLKLKDKELTYGDSSDTTGYNGPLSQAFDPITPIGTDLVTLYVYSKLKWANLKVMVDGVSTALLDGTTYLGAGTYSFDDSTLDSYITKEIALQGADAGNYKLKPEFGTLTVKPAEVTLTWDTNAKTAYTVANAPTADTAIKATAWTVNSPTTYDATAFGALTFTYEDNYGSTAGAHKAKVTKIVVTGTGADVTSNYNIRNNEFNWTVGKTSIKVYVTGQTEVFYGSTKEEALANFNKTKLQAKILGENGVWGGLVALPTTGISGTPTFETEYQQYDNVGFYKVKYAGGLTSDVYEFVDAPDSEITVKALHVVAVPVGVTANKVTAGVDAPEPDLSKEYTLSDLKNQSPSKNNVKGAADALARDIKDGRITVKVTTTAYQTSPHVVGSKHPITMTFENASASDPAVTNYSFFLVNGTTETAKTSTDKERLAIEDPQKFIFTWGDFTLKFEDTEVAYDGAAHSIEMTPAIADLPAGLDVYFIQQPSTAFAPKGYGATLATNGKENADGANGIGGAAGGKVSDFTKAAIKNTLPTATKAGTYKVYIYVVSNTMDLHEWETRTLTIKSKAAAVKDLIDEATTPDAEGKLDPEKIKEAREAYDDLTADEKKEISTAEVRKLEDAEAAVKDQVDKAAAKAVEDEIDKLPAVDKVTADDKAAADKAVEDYNKLTDDQKKLVPADKVKKMNDVKAAADAAGEDADKKAAKAVEDEIAALPEADKATAADKAAADKAKADYDALTDAQKALVPTDAVDKMNAVKAAADQAAEEEKKAKEEVAALDEKVAAVKAAKNGADGKKAAEDAKDYYDKMSDDAKALMTDEEKAAYEASQEAYKMDKTFESGEGVFRVLSNGEVTFLKPLHPENTWFVVPNQVKKNGFMYKVVKVSTKAFMGCEKATKIKIGKNVQSIGAYAFKNTPAMGKLIMLTSKLASGKVKDSFVSGGKDKGAKLTNEVPSGKSSAYESLFKGEGGMNAGAKFTEAN